MFEPKVLDLEATCYTPGLQKEAHVPIPKHLPIWQRLYIKASSCVRESWVLILQRSHHALASQRTTISASEITKQPTWIVRPTSKSIEADGTEGHEAEGHEAKRAEAEAASVMAALRTVGFHLAHQGFELGQDFSIGEGQLILSSAALHYLEQQIGADQRDDIATTSPDLLVYSSRAAMDALETHLNVPFFATLKAAMLVRLPELSDSELLGYVTHLMQGFGQRHPEIGEFDQWVQQVVHEAIDAEQLRHIKQRYGAGQIQIGDEDGWIMLVDVLQAAGGVEEIHFQQTMDGLIATPAGKKLLDQVIAGAYTRVVD